MSFQCMRRALLGLASAALLLLGGCGSGTIESQLTPSRVIVFGDAFSDAGQTAAPNVPNAKYTVNDGSPNNWAQIIAANYGVPLTPAVSGGTAYATGNARVMATPDAAGETATLTIQQQIDAFLASNNNSVGSNDLVIISGGFSDVIAEMAAYRSGAQSSDQMLANVGQAGRDLAAQAKRLVAAGGKHVLVVGVYDLGRSPWAASIGQQALLTSATQATTDNAGKNFNGELQTALVDQGQNMLYVDAALLFNQMINSPGTYALDNVSTPVCTSVDAGPGIGIGASQVTSISSINSKLCTPATIAVGADYTRALFADAVYPTPAGHAQFGNHAYSRLRNRW
jgi:outer membrane lipase/esterase